MKIPKINVSDTTQQKLLKAGLIVGLFFIGKKALAKAGKNNADEKLDTDPAAGQARGLNAAMNPSGNNWMRSFDGTSTDAIYEIAAQITKLDDVRSFYKLQHEGKRDLNDDLESEIGAEGFQKFLALATKGKTGNPKFAKERKDIPANKWVITIKDANIRTTPKNINKYYPTNNIVKLVKAGKAIGVATGKFGYDEANDTTFIEFYTLGSKVAGKHFFYVAKSQIEYLSNEEKIKREKSGKIPFEVLAGLNGVSDHPQTQAITIRSTIIYSEKFQPIAIAQKNIIVGFPIAFLNGKNNNYVKIQTVEGKIRWVVRGDVKILNRI